MQERNRTAVEEPIVSQTSKSVLPQPAGPLNATKETISKQNRTFAVFMGWVLLGCEGLKWQIKHDFDLVDLFVILFAPVLICWGHFSAKVHRPKRDEEGGSGI